jgi:hypothetical protein
MKIVLVSLAVTVLLIVFPGLILGVFRLTFGWAVFFHETAPRIRVHPGMVLSGLSTLGLAAVLLHFIARTLRARGWPDAVPWRWRWTAALVAAKTVLFAICVCAAGVATHATWLVEDALSPSAKGWVNYPSVQLEVRKLHTACGNYARDHGDRFPDRWEDLIQSTLPSDRAELVDCLRVDFRTSGEVPEHWILLGGIGRNAAPDLPLFYTSRTLEPGRHWVVFVDGELVQCSHNEFVAALARWRAVREAAAFVSSSSEGGVRS